MKRQLLLFVIMLVAVIMPMKLWAADGNPEPYAVLSDNNTKLTFFYDDQKAVRNGMDIMSNDYPSWYSQRESITRVIFDDSFAGCTTLTSTAYWFYGCKNMVSISGIEYLNTNNVTDMAAMFSDCSGLTSLDLSGFNTANVTDMSAMFSDCSGLTSLDIRHFNTANVTIMGSMFYGCYRLTSLDVSGFNTTNVTDLGGMFSRCSNLTSLDVSGFNTENVTNMSEMFSDCSGLTSLDVSGFNTGKVMYMSRMFSGCFRLTDIDLSHFNTNNVTDMNSMFHDCSGLTSLDVTNFKTDNVTSMGYMFDGCKSLTSLDVSRFNTDSVKYVYGMFSGCSGLTSLDVSHFNTANVTNMSRMFCYCYRLTSLDLSGFNTGKVMDMSEMFSECSRLKTIYAGSEWTTDAVTSGNNMFLNCTSLVSGAGTPYDANHTDYTYAHIDGGTSNPGYLTDKNAPVVIIPEPYVVLSENNTKLTFFYDDQKEVRDGMSVGPFINSTEVAWKNQRESITTAEFDPSFANCTSITSTAYWFYECKNMMSISGLQYLKTDNVTDMSWMFFDCSGLTSLDVSSFNTANVTDMRLMFNGCSSLTNLDVKGFNTTKVKGDIVENTGFSSMFSGCSSLTSLDLSSFNTANAKTLSNMFSGCSSLTSLDLSSFNTKNVERMDYMFNGCSGLMSLDLSNFNTDNVTNMVCMFSDCSGLTSLDLHNFNTTNVISMGSMFRGCSSLMNLNVSGFNTSRVTQMWTMFSDCSSLTTLDISHFITVNVTDMGYMFNGCSGLTSLDLSSFDTSNVTDIHGMFSDCSGLTSLDIRHFNTANVTDMSSMFFSCSGLTSLDVSNFKTDKVKDMHYMFYGCSGLTSLDVSNFMTDNVKDMHSMFDNCSSLLTLDVNGFNTDNVTDMSKMFRECSGLTSLDLSNFNTDNVTDMGGMFYNCSGVTTLDVSGFNTENVTDMSGMFDRCMSLTSLDLSNFNTANVTDMSSMFGDDFGGCSSLTSLDLSNFDTSNVTNMYGMFHDCSNLMVLDLSSFNTSNVTNMYGMFHDCSNLMVLDLSNFNTAKVTNMKWMFFGCSGLITIYVSDGWNTELVAGGDAMFSGCIYLIGGSGTHYDKNHMDYTYAHIDGGTANPGYFTRSGETPYVAVDPYAVLSEDNTVLTFYYDTKRVERKGVTVGPFSYSFDAPWYSQRESITTVEFKPSFADCTSITSTAYWFHGCSNLTVISGIEYLKTDNVTDMDHMFSGCYRLTSLDVSGFNTANATDMGSMFSGCFGLTSLDVGNFMTDKVKDMHSMFYSCSSLTNLDVSRFNTENVTNMSEMFEGCSGLTSLDVSGFNTAKVTGMKRIFYDCSSLTSLDVSHFNTEKVTDLSYMFSFCSSLTNLDVSHFNTENVTNMGNMFRRCYRLTSLDVSHFNTANVTYMSDIFRDCSGLKTIYAGSGWTTAVVTEGSEMFTGCTSLVGGAGTPYDANHTDYTYAHIDGGENNPGYLTGKGEGMTVNKLYIIGSGTAGEWNATTEMPFNDATKAFEYTIENTSTAWITFGIQPLNGDWGVFNNNYRYAIGNGNVVPVIGQEYQLVPSPETGCVMIEEQGKYFISVTKDLRMTIIKDGDEHPGTNIYVESEQAPYLYAFDANDQALNGEFPGNQMTKTVTIDGKQFWTTKISSTDPFNINIIDGNQYRTREIYVISDRYFTYLGLSSYRDVTEQYANAPEIQISSIALTGNHNEWGRNDLFTEVEPGKQYTMDVDLTNVTLEDDVMQFKLYANACAWLGITSLTLEAPSYVHSVGDPALGTSSRNFYMDLNEAPTRHFKFEAVWRGGTQMEEGWTLTITEVNPAEAEPYAVLSENNTKLTFFYDEKKTMRGGMGVGPFDLDNYPSWYNQRESITTVEFDDSFANCTTLTSTVLWFYNCGKITSFIGISNLKTDNVMDMGLMFSGCSGLTSLDLSSFNTTNVMSMNSMFSYCSSLTSLEVGRFNTANVDNMLNMFYGCSSLTSLDVSRFNTANVTVMSGMFQNCSALTTIDVSNFNTEKVTGMTSMFADCSSLTNLDVANFNTANVTRMGTMFGNCSSLTSLDLSSFNTANVTDMYYMFSGCRKLVSLDISNFDMSKVINEERNMFVECFSLASIIAGNANIPAEEYSNIGNPNLLVYVNEARLAPSTVQNVVVNGLAREIVLTDAQGGNNDWYAPQTFVAERISYTRNFTQSTTKGVSRGWESIALPFRVQTIQHETKGVIAPFNNPASSRHFWLRRLGDSGLQAATSIEANTPYVISMPNSEEYTDDYNLNGRVTFSAQNVQVPATVTNTLAMADSSIVMVPAMQRKERSSAVWALNVGEVRGQYFEGSVFERDYREVRPFEAYTVHRQNNGQPAPRYVPIKAIGGTTGIETINPEPLTVGQWYDLEGRKLQGKPAQKGVYICNGKKVVVK